MARTASRAQPGWAPYVWPLISFLCVVELARHVPPRAAALLLPVQVAVPLCLLLVYLLRGHYPELRSYRPTLIGVGMDVLVGVAGAGLWMAPYLLIESWRPGPEHAFDPRQLGAAWVWLALGLRGLGYGLVTPLVEELFARSWLHRWVVSLDAERDFRDLPVGRYTWKSFLAVVVYWGISHLGWEVPVAVAWAATTTLWLYLRKHLVSLVIVHAASNLTIFVAVVWGSGQLTDAGGRPLDLWFFL